MGLIQKLRGIGLACLFVLLLMQAHVVTVGATSIYGRGTYGNCTYNTCGQHTVVQTPSGLQLAINLTNGQTIPASGYTIEITPLNGSGSSFKQADVYIDGTKVTTILPGSDGTGRWTWDPKVNPGTHIEIRAIDPAGNTTSYSFTVVIGAVSATTNQASGTSAGGTNAAPASGQRFFVAQLLSDATQRAKQIIRKLPAPVVYTFPYLLFALLLCEIVILLLQTKRELRELETTKQLTAAEREISGMKQTFMELVSHYLRTPLTILQGGAEGLPHDGVPAATVTSLQGVIKQLHDTIEALISTTNQAVGNVVSAAGPEQSQKRRFALSTGQIALWLPVVLVGIVVFIFVYLANEVSRFNTNTIGILTQVVVYSILILSLYQVARRWHLHRHDTQGAKKILAEEQAVQTSRDNLITQTAGQLQSQVTALGTLTKGLPPTAANAKFVSRGFDQLNAVTSKFIIASHLRGARSQEAYAASSLKTLYEQVAPALTQAAAQKQVGIDITVDAPFTVQNSSLVSLVLQTVLDNAIAYSKPNGNIELAAATAAKQVTVTVTDHGTGVEKSKQEALFQPFFKVEGAEEFNREGMGFSLYLDKLIMAYIGGTIGLASEPGSFTKLTLTWHQP